MKLNRKKWTAIEDCKPLWFSIADIPWLRFHFLFINECFLSPSIREQKKLGRKKWTTTKSCRPQKGNICADQICFSDAKNKMKILIPTHVGGSIWFDHKIEKLTEMIFINVNWYIRIDWLFIWFSERHIVSLLEIGGPQSASLADFYSYCSRKHFVVIYEVLFAFENNL